MTFDASGEEIQYQEELSKALCDLQNKHSEYFRIINVSERRYDILQMNQPGQVVISKRITCFSDAYAFNHKDFN